MNVSAKLYCKKGNRNKSGLSPVYILVRINNVDRMISTGKFVNPTLFDNAAGKTRKGQEDSMRLNAYLSDKLRRVERIILDLQEQGREVTHDRVIATFEMAGKENSFVEFCRRELRAEASEMSDKYYKDIAYILNKIEAYSPSLSFKDISFESLQDFKRYLIQVKKNKPNSIKKAFAIFGKYINIAIRKGMLTKNPLIDLDIPTQDTEREHLSLKELQKVHELYDSGTLSEALHNTLSYFLLSCYTGLRSSDVKRLNISHIEEGQLGIRMKKTSKMVYIPLGQRALRLIQASQDDRLFPKNLKQSYSRVNNDLAQIMKLAGIKKHITFHCSRHTFAVNSLTLGIPIEVLQDVLGHEDLKTTQVYTRIVDDLRRKEMSKWNF